MRFPALYIIILHHRLLSDTYTEYTLDATSDTLESLT